MLKAIMGLPLALCALVGSAMAACDNKGQPIVCELTGYDPDSPTGYTPPSGTCPTTRADYRDPVLRAFAVAPPRLQAEICALTKVFVTDLDYSWGLWENPVNQTPDGRKPDTYVGLSSAILAKPFNEYADLTLKAVLKNPNAPVSHTVGGIPTADSPKLTVMAVLAHEIAHIKWHKENIYSALACYYDAFVYNNSANQEKSWSRNDRLASSATRRFHPPPTDNDPSGGADHARNVPHPKEGYTAAPLPPGRIRQIYEGGFASAFASLSPEEDFVETYTLETLKRSKLSSFTFTVRFPGAGPAPFDIKNNATAPLPDKIACISPLLSPPPAPRRRR